MSDTLAIDIKAQIGNCADDIAGFTVPRQIAFLSKPIRYGGLYPPHIVRVFRYGRAHSEQRIMDEHIVVSGRVARLTGTLLDDNLKPLGWRIDKQNRYASREALAVMLDEASGQSDDTGDIGRQAAVKRWLKISVYYRLPPSLRSLGYFFHRYIIRGGFRDGYIGLVFHFLQGFWYRFLVDAKLFEARRYMRENGASLSDTAHHVLGVQIPVKPAEPTQTGVVSAQGSETNP